MKWLCFGAAGVGIILGSFAWAQTPGNSPDGNGDTKLELLSRKLDEQTKKIDLLSQEILKLEQQLANARPGVLIGEGAPNYSPTPSASESPHPAAGNSHTVARGETLTSIAKMYNVSVAELQKYNHIENDRKLQIGQTLAIPGPGTSPSPSPSSSSSPAAE